MRERAWIAVDWERHRRLVEAGGTTINTVGVQGEAGQLPLVFIHGLGGCWQNWLEQLPVLGPRFGAIAYDLPGFGDSPPLPGETTISALTLASQALLDELDLERVHLVGNSMGGLIACELALAAPQRVAALTLISPAGFPLPLSSSRLRILEYSYPLMQAAGRYIASHPLAVARRPRARNALLRAVAAHPERFDPLLAVEQFKGMGKAALLPALHSLLSHSLEGRLAALRELPTLLIWGELDPVLPLELADHFERELPGLEKIVLPEVGHVAMLEAPAEVNRLITAHHVRFAAASVETA